MPGFPTPQTPPPRTADSPEPIPAAGVMFHLLGAVALGWSVIIWAVLATFGVITASAFGVAVASIALTGSAAWSLWLVRATQGRGQDGHGPGCGCGCDCAGRSPLALHDAGRVHPEEHFHRN